MSSKLTDIQLNKKFKRAFVLSKFQNKTGVELATIQYIGDGQPRYITTKVNSRLYKNVIAQEVKRKKNKIKRKKARQAKKNKINDITIGKFKNLGKKNISLATTFIKPDAIEVMNQNINFLGDLVERVINNYRMQINNVFSGGFNSKFRIFFSNMADRTNEKFKIVSSKVLDKNSTRNDIIQILNIIANKQHDTEQYTLFLAEISSIVSPLSSSGGCNPKNGSCEKLSDSEENNHIKIYSLKSNGNNCLFSCFNKFYGLAGNKIKSSKTRKDLNFTADEKISVEDIYKVSEYYNRMTGSDYGYHIINENCENIKIKITDKDFIRIYIRNDHYYLFTDTKLKNKCKICGKYYNEKHTCNQKMITYYQKQIIKKKNDSVIKCRTEADKLLHEMNEKLNYNRVVHFDIETFNKNLKSENNKLIPYAIGWHYQGVYYMKCGAKCMKEFIKWMNKREKLILNAFNGSRFDYYFLIDEMINMNIPVRNIILSNGRVISFEFGSTRYGQSNKIFDLCLFINSSLKKACEDFKTDICKSNFDHKLITKWDDVYKHMPTWEPYLKLDVYSMKELFEKFNDMMFELEQVNITDYMTLSHMGYEIWLNTLDDTHLLEIPDMEQYEFIKLATFGGRTYPHQKEFKSKLHDKIDGGEVTYDEVLKSFDFYFNADATGLYPASMAGFDLCDVLYPNSRSLWTMKSKKAFKQGFLGFYEINYFPPKDITVPILPQRKENGGVEWSLRDNTGVYTSVDIQNAINAGYRIEFINRALVYEKSSSSTFTKYISNFCKMKKLAEENDEPCKRAIAKLLLNSLYGKQLQRAIFNNTVIVNDVFEFNNFFHDYNLNDWQEISNNKFLLTGESKDKETRITKASQLGAFITAYSRRIMLLYMKAVDPTLKTIVFSYTDTDSLHITAEAYFKLKDMGYIVTKENAKLGYLCSDIKNEGLIYYEKNLGPKIYHYKYIDNKNNLGKTNKTKGIPQGLLKSEWFINEKAEKEPEFESLRKINKHITVKQRDEGLTNFNIIQIDMKRSFNKSQWQGMQHNNNLWLPLGYTGSLI